MASWVTRRFPPLRDTNFPPVKSVINSRLYFIIYNYTYYKYIRIYFVLLDFKLVFLSLASFEASFDLHMILILRWAPYLFENISGKRSLSGHVPQQHGNILLFAIGIDVRRWDQRPQRDILQIKEYYVGYLTCHANFKLITQFVNT